MSELGALNLVAQGTKSSLGGGIKEALRAAILSGELPPGYRLRESPLAQHFQVSSTPVREALRQLESEGLVTFYPRRGAVVSDKTPSDVRNLYDIRIALECYAVRLVAGRHPDAAALEPARAIVERQEQSLEDDPTVAPPLDADFHRELALLAGNPEMAAIIENTTLQIVAVQARSKAVVKDGASSAAAAHAALLERVAAGDVRGAEKLMREHLKSACEMVCGSLSAARSISGERVS